MQSPPAAHGVTILSIEQRSPDQREEELSRFKRSPLVEVAVAVQFQPETFTSLDAATLWSRIREDYPSAEEQPSRPQIGEDFTDPPAASSPFQIEVISAPTMTRYWFLSEDGTRLVQLQHDLVAFNWRRWPPTDEEAEYPYYPTLRRELRDKIETLVKLLQEEGRDEPTPNWCEVTYINHVLPVEREQGRPSLSRVLSFVRAVDPEALPPVEDAQLAQRYRYVADDKTPRGRLTFSMSSATRTADLMPIWVLTLVSHLRATPSTLEGAISALDEGRLWANDAFVSLTSSEMHERWERER